MGAVSRLVVLTAFVGGATACGSTVYSPGMPEVDGGSSAGASSGTSGASSSGTSGASSGSSSGTSGGSSGLSSGNPSGPTETAVDVIVQAIGGPNTPTVPLNLGGIGVDATDVYVMASDQAFNNYLVKTPKSGSPSTSVYQSSQGFSVSLAIDGTSAYFQTAGAVSVVPLTGGTAGMVHNSQCQSGNVALNASNVFWACPAEQVWSRTKAVGPVVNVGGGGPLYGLAADDEKIYVATFTSISTMPTTGGTLSPLVSLPGTISEQPSAVAVDASRVYWIQASNIYAVPKTGGATEPIVTLNASNVNRPNKALATDATHVWWTTSSGRIVRALK